VSPPLDESYFQWLYGQVADPEESKPSRTHWGLLKQLYTKEFAWFVPNDDNRAEDGKALRAEFIEESDIPYVDESWLTLGCSMLELLIGLSRRLTFQAEGEPRDWFWRLIKNAGLHVHSDRQKFPRVDVDQKLDGIIWRKYEYNGHGGLFPLSYSYADQTEVELWYQLQAYLIENC
jgi:hypothetical protein